MRHEAPVQLTQHPIREHIPDEPWAHIVQLDAVAEKISDVDMADYDIIQEDYQWPESWSRRRRALMLFACTSEVQLLAYLQGMRHPDMLDGALHHKILVPNGFRDKKCDWVAGIRVVKP